MIELLSGLSGWAAAGIVALVSIVGAWFAGRQSGAKSEQWESSMREAQRNQKQADAIRKHVQERQDAQKDVNRLPDGDAAERLSRDWTRGD